MADKYGFIDAHYYLCECTLDGERVEDRMQRGNDAEGWVDLFPVDDEGHFLSLMTVRERGEVVFRNVRIVQRHGYLASNLVEEIYHLKDRLAQLRLDFNEMQQAFSGPRADRGATIVVGGDDVQADQGAEPALERASTVLRWDETRPPTSDDTTVAPGDDNDGRFE